MLRHALLVVLISARLTRPSRSTPIPSGVARWRFSTTAWNRADDGWMPWVAATHAGDLGLALASVVGVRVAGEARAHELGVGRARDRVR